jgi:hypothetical protein
MDKPDLTLHTFWNNISFPHSWILTLFSSLSHNSIQTLTLSITNKLIHARGLPKQFVIIQLVEKLPAFAKHENVFLCLQNLVSGKFPVPAQSISHNICL